MTAAVEATALDELRFVLEGVFSRIEQFEQPDAVTTLHTLYTALYHQLEDGLMLHAEFERQRFVALKAWNLKIHLDLLESGCVPVSDVIADIVSSMLDLFLYVIPKPLFVCACSRLYASTGR